MVLGLFIQPAILLYDRFVMQAAAAETCRAIASSDADSTAVKEYALRRLGAVPKAGVFHVGGDAGWSIELSGGELSEDITVEISHTVDPLPLFGITAGLASNAQSDGTIRQSVSAQGGVQPSWACGKDADEWIAAWD